MKARLTQGIGWSIFGLVSAYAVGLSCFALVNPGWKPHRVETAWYLFGFVFLFGLAGLLRPTAPSGEAPPPTGRVWWPVSLALALGAVAYSGALTVGFLSDDFVLIESRNPAGVWDRSASHFVRVLPVALLQTFDAWSPTRAALVAHAANLALHLTNGALLFAIARRLRLTATASTLAAALFVLYPASPEAVVWASGLQDVLMVTASLAFVLGVLDGRHPLGLAVCLVAGLLSKETAVAMPLLGVAALWARGARPPAPMVWTIAACVVVVLAFGVWRVTASDGAFAAAPTRFLFKEIVAGAFGTLAFPWMTAELGHAVLPGVLAVAVVMLGAWIVVGTRAPSPAPRVVALGVMWVVLSVAPVYTMFFVSNALEGSRYLYLASAGWALMLASAAIVVSRPARAYRWLAAAMVGVWAVGTHGHVATWQRASIERDRIVAAAQAVHAPDCPAIAFTKATDNVAGAYVFRNGLGPALRRAGVTAAVDVGEPTACVFTWTGEAFTRTR